MDWIQGIQRAIDYIEERLDEELDYAEVAAQAYSSPFRFQRIFSCLCGCTLGEYIRARRLSVAGAELASGNVKVIDVALKYGYESPESFMRAFQKFHGIPPSAAKRQGARLKSFSRLSVKLSLSGGSLMNYQIVSKQAFRVLEKRETVDIDDNVNRNTIPAFWTHSHADGTVKTLYERSRQGKLFGVCYGNVSNDAKTFIYSIAAEYDGGEVPEGFTVTEIPAQTWAVFLCKGSMPDAIQNTWHAIYAEFFPASCYRPANGIDIETYPAGDMNAHSYESEIWVSVEKSHS